MDALFWATLFLGTASALMLLTFIFVRGLTKIFNIDIDIED